jgi:heme oxygenase
MGDQPVASPLPAHMIAQTQDKRTQTLMLQVGFEPTIPVFERAKTVHALDRAATVIGSYYCHSGLNLVAEYRPKSNCRHEVSHH